MSKDPFGIREGEVAIDLPTQFDAGLYFIGRIRTPWTRREDCPKNANEARKSGVECTIEVDERYAAGLRDVASCSHLLVLYWMDKARRDLVVQKPRHYDEQRGTFALRSPVRPNPIAASVVQLLKRRGIAPHGGGARLPRRHAAPRPQALFRLHRRRPRGDRGLAW